MIPEESGFPEVFPFKKNEVIQHIEIIIRLHLHRVSTGRGANLIRRRLLERTRSGGRQYKVLKHGYGVRLSNLSRLCLT